MGGTFEMTEVIHDMLTHGHEGIHPGQYNGAYGKQSCAFLPTNLVREFLKMVYWVSEIKFRNLDYPEVQLYQICEFFNKSQ